MTMAAAADYEFEKIGVPCTIKALPMQLVSTDAEGNHVAWGDYESPTERAIIGVDLETGETTWVDVGMHGFSHIAMTLGVDGNIYIYTGRPAHFLRYHVNTGDLEDLGCPAAPGYYFGRGQQAPDGRFFIGSYPATSLVSVDTRTGEIEHHADIAEDPLEKYLWPSLAVSDDGIVYCPVGLHHRELWSYNPETGQKHQILPEELTEAQGCPGVWLAEDGQVYGKAGNTRFLCQPDRIVTDVDVLPSSDLRAEPRMAGDKKVHKIDEQGRLTYTDTTSGETGLVQTDYEGQPQMIYSVGCKRGSKIWGGALFPSNSWYYDTETGELKDLGRIVRGGCQIYDVMSLPEGLLMSSYTGACMDLYDPDRPLGDDNPLHFKRVPGQERPPQYAKGPDGHVYIGTVPVKGRLGGALVRLNVQDGTREYWTNIIENQSILYLAPVPETNEMFCVSSISGGSSAVPTEDEAVVFLWDCEKEEINHIDRPVPGTTSYGRAIRADTGIIYGIAGNQYYAYDPVKRETVFVGDRPEGRAHFPQLNDHPVGPDGLIYGLNGDSVIAIDPSDHSMSVVTSHDSISGAHGFYVTDDQVLYYGNDEYLWRCDLKGQSDDGE
ncbi:MAG: hypothetical protein ACLFWB_02340 [Armatimonadota bacterium]